MINAHDKHVYLKDITSFVGEDVHYGEELSWLELYTSVKVVGVL